jgi:N-acetylglutamate synthase-like GNAT family acetyltransferase
MEIFVRQAQESDIEKIKPYIDEYGLDNEDLDYRRFYIAIINNKLAGFGRLKQYDDVYELATIGVIKKFRRNGIGKKIIKELICVAPSKEIWLTTIIPEYFEQFGFVEDDNIPDEILLKCARVCGRLNKTTRNSRYMCYKKVDF